MIQCFDASMLRCFDKLSDHNYYAVKIAEAAMAFFRSLSLSKRLSNYEATLLDTQGQKNQTPNLVHRAKFGVCLFSGHYIRNRNFGICFFLAISFEIVKLFFIQGFDPIISLPKKLSETRLD